MRWVACFSLCGFYAEIARRRRELPAGVPVIVVQAGLAMDGDRAAYSLGLRTGSQVRQARRTCPGAVLVEYEEKEYLAAAEAFWRRCLEHTPLVEPGAGGVEGPATLHRVCLGLPTPSAQPPRAEVAAMVQALVPAFGFAAAAGIGSNRLVAGAAARLQQRVLLGLDGARRGGPAPAPAGGAFPVVVAPGQEASFLAPLSLDYLWPATEPERRRLADLGLARIGDLAAVPGAELVRQFGPRGQALSRWSHGLDPEPVRAAWPPRTAASRLVLTAPAADSVTLAAAAARLAAGLALALQRRDEAGQHLALRVELAGGGERRAERTFSRPQSSAYFLEQSLLALLRQVLTAPAAGAPPPAVSALEAVLDGLAPVARRQASLLADLPEAAAPAAPVAPATLAGAVTQAAPAASPAPAAAPRHPAPDPERAARLELTVAALRERYPAQVLHLGMPAAASRREAMLTLYDPYRWRPGEEGEQPWPGSSASR